MNKISFSLVGAALLIGGVAFAQEQQQYDSLGSPTPAPQTATPGMTGPNVPIPGGSAQNDGYNITPSAQGSSLERPQIVKPNENSTANQRPAAGPILANPKQPVTTGQGGTSPNPPLADD
jgi:hypothetical protein